METRTLFSDETQYYRFPAEPDPFDTVRIRFRTGRYQALHLDLCLRDRNIPMQWESEKNDFDFYFAELPVETEPVYYYFRAELKEGTVYFGRNGVMEDLEGLVPFSILPGFHTPEWSKGCLFYQIFPDRFCNGDTGSKVSDTQYQYGGAPVIKSAWGDPICLHTFRQFYGGDLQGIISKLPYLKNLGIEAIYLNPIFASPSSHKYDCCDYEHVDFGFASTQDEEIANQVLALLISKAHELGIRVVLDGVFNHCSSYHKWFDKSHRYSVKNRAEAGAFANPGSRFHNRFLFFDEECRDYEAWWGVPTLPKLNYENDSSLCEDIFSIGQKWISPPFNADGWRLDVGADLGHSEEFNHRFWQQFRTAVRTCRPDSLVMAEHYEDPSAWFNGKEWDSIMNYAAFMEPVSYFFTGVEKHSDYFIPELKGNAEQFADSLVEQSALFPGNSLLSSLNQLDNHDHSRFLTRTTLRTGRLFELGSQSAEEGTDPAVLRQAAAFMYFWTGSPGLYYGDEAGVCGFTDPDNRRCYPWGREDPMLLDYFQKLGQLRQEVSFIKTASCKILYAREGILSFARFTDHEILIVTVSAAEERRSVKLPVWVAGLPGYEKSRFLDGVLTSDSYGFSFEHKPYVAHYGILEAELDPGSLFVVVSSE